MLIFHQKRRCGDIMTSWSTLWHAVHRCRKCWETFTLPSSIGLSLMWTTGPGWALEDLKQRQAKERPDIDERDREKDRERKMDGIRLHSAKRSHLIKALLLYEREAERTNEGQAWEPRSQSANSGAKIAPSERTTCRKNRFESCIYLRRVLFLIHY